jgi:gamma-glutamylcyclotransferase (GGCT)/AIG2-like uncharacterized protein YtfP
MSGKTPVFVYGSLLAGFENHRLYVLPYPHRSAPARIKGVLYHLPDGYPGLLRDESGIVQGELIWFQDDVYETALAGLDELETYVSPGDERNEYERILVEAAITDSGEVVQAYTYLYNDETHAKTAGIHVADGDWRRFLRTWQRVNRGSLF